MKQQRSDVETQFATSAFARFACFILLSVCGALLPGTDVSCRELQKRPFLEIQEVTSLGGITAWLVENHNLPIFTLSFSFRGGAAQDPLDKPGTSHFVSRMLDQGAGDLDAVAFQLRKDDIAMRLRFQSYKDRLSGMLETLTEHRDAATELLRLALNKPRFEQSAMGIVRDQILTKMIAESADAKIVARKRWDEIAFSPHPYGRPVIGTEKSVKAISRHDLTTYHKRIFGQNGLNVVAVGDIDRNTLKPLLDRVFGALPSKQELMLVEQAAVSKSAKITSVKLPVPQSVVLLGLQGIKGTDPDFTAADLITHVLGGDSDFSRLWTEVRERRGLAYEASSALDPNCKAPTLKVTVATRPQNVAEVIDVVRTEMRRIARHGVSMMDLANVKDYLTGSFPLKFNTNAKTAATLLRIREQKLGMDYMNTHIAKVEAVSLEDIKRVAARLLIVSDLQIVVVGDPDEAHIPRHIRDPNPQ